MGCDGELVSSLLLLVVLDVGRHGGVCGHCFLL